jgi:YkoY family integral membrane protein
MLEYLGLIPFVPSDLITVLVLVVMEGLLSCDNAVVLALLVKNLPEEQKAKALKYGIIGAYAFRIAALMLATYILSYWWLKVIGGMYLLYVAGQFFLQKEDKDDDGIADVKTKTYFGLSAFWSTVIAVELTDIAFSVDSIAAAVALSNKLWVLIAGGLLGILAMRFAAQGFIYLLKKFPALEVCAFIAVAFIGLKLVSEIPADVILNRYDAKIEHVYTNAKEYEELAEKVKVSYSIPHVVTLTTIAPEKPSTEMIKDEKEFLKAEAHWNSEYRPLVELDHIASSIIVMLIFAFGFIIPNKHKKEVEV